MAGERLKAWLVLAAGRSRALAAQGHEPPAAWWKCSCLMVRTSTLCPIHCLNT